MKMTPSLYIKLVDNMMQTHYGLSPSDFELSEEMAGAYINGNVLPHEYVQMLANDFDFNRIDVEGSYGMPSSAPVLMTDQQRAMVELLPLFDYMANPVKCPNCYSGVSSELLQDRYHFHACADAACGTLFLTHALPMKRMLAA